ERRDRPREAVEEARGDVEVAAVRRRGDVGGALEPGARPAAAVAAAAVLDAVVRRRQLGEAPVERRALELRDRARAHRGHVQLRAVRAEREAGGLVEPGGGAARAAREAVLLDARAARDRSERAAQ